MRSILTVIAAGLVALAASETYAQQTMRTNGLEVVGNTGTLSLTYTGIGPATFSFPQGASTVVPQGASNGQTLHWNNTATEWQIANNLINDGTNLSVPSGNVLVGAGNITLSLGTFNGNGSGLTTLNATNISGGLLDIVRISTSGADPNDVLTFDGVNLVYAPGGGAASELDVPFTQTEDEATTMFSLTNTNITTGTTALFTNSGNSSSSAITGSNTAAGIGISGLASSGTGVHGRSTNGIAASFEITNNGNSNNVLQAATNGEGSAGSFTTTHTTSTLPTVTVVNSGLGVAGNFSNTNTLSSDAAIIGTTVGDASSIAVRGSADDGYAVLGNSTNGIGVSGSSGGFYGVMGTSSTASGVYGSSTSGIGVYGTSFTGTAAKFDNFNPASLGNAVEASTSSTGFGSAILGTNNGGNGRGITGSSIGGIGIYGSSSSSTGVHGGSSSGAGISGISSTGPGGTFSSGAVGLEITGGGLVGSTATIASGGQIAATVMTVFVTEDGTAAAATALVPATGTTGQIIHAATNDDNGLTIGSSSVTGDNSAITLIYLSGEWRTTR